MFSCRVPTTAYSAFIFMRYFTQNANLGSSMFLYVSRMYLIMYYLMDFDENVYGVLRY